MSNAKLWVGPVFLEPIEHKYIHRKTGKKYKSVTTTLTSIEPHFDSDSVAEAISKQRDDKKQERYIGLSKDEILEMWVKLNDDANVYGTMVHDIVERYLLGNGWYFPAGDNAEFEQKVIDSFNELEIEMGQAVWPERILFAEQYELAGMSDLIIDIDDVYFDILDHKTNRVFNFYNPHGYETLHKPFDHLQACQWSIYTLQLSVYAYMYMLEFPNRKCRQIVILYWDKEKESFEKIHVMFMLNEAKKLVDMHYHNIMKS